MSEVPLSIGALVAQERERRGVTRVALAVGAGIHPNTLQRIETGKAVPTLDTVTRIARALDIDLGELIP